jgi:hypothetical protein
MDAQHLTSSLLIHLLRRPRRHRVATSGDEELLDAALRRPALIHGSAWPDPMNPRNWLYCAVSAIFSQA